MICSTRIVIRCKSHLSMQFDIDNRIRRAHGPPTILLYKFKLCLCQCRSTLNLKEVERTYGTSRKLLLAMVHLCTVA